MPRLKTKKEFVINANKRHNYKYDYSKSFYVNNKTPIIIICRNKKHGYFKFLQTPNTHLAKEGCPRCSGCHHYNTKEIIREFKKVHKYKYDYSKVNYVNTNKKVIIICRIHGEFMQSPHGHLYGQGCRRCGIEIVKLKITKPKEEFIRKAKLIHNLKYNYDKIIYTNGKTKIMIGCNVEGHGYFYQTPSSHLAGSGCLKMFRKGIFKH